MRSCWGVKFATPPFLLHGAIMQAGTINMPKNSNKTDESLYNIDEKGKVSLNYIQIVKMLQKKYHTIAYGGRIYVYVEGVYADGEVVLKSEISNIAIQAGISGSVTRPTHEIMHYLKTLEPEYDYPFNRYDNAIPVQNGVVRVDFDSETFELVPHDPKYRFNYRFTVDYVNVKEGTERIIHNDAFCKYVDKNSVETLYQMFVQPILQALGSAPFKKAYLLQGDPDAGKSSFLEIPLKLFGNKLHSHVSLQHLAEDRFALAGLEGKMLNVYDDLSNVLMKDGGVFKTLTGKKRHSIQHKGYDIYDADLFAVHIYTCNSPPEVGDRVQSDTAFWERWEYVIFSNHFEKDPYFFERTFTPENMSVLLYDILIHVLKVRKNGLSVNSAASEVRELWNYNADPLYKYIETNFEDCESDTHISKDKLLDSYKRWCVSNDVEGSKILGTESAFTRALDKYQVVAGKITTSDGRVPCYTMAKRWSQRSGFACDCLIPKRQQSTL